MTGCTTIEGNFNIISQYNRDHIWGESISWLYCFPKRFFLKIWTLELIHNSNKAFFMVFCYCILQNCSIRQASYWKRNGAKAILKSQIFFCFEVSRDISILVIQSRLQVLKLSLQILVKSQITKNSECGFKKGLTPLWIGGGGGFRQRIWYHKRG